MHGIAVSYRNLISIHPVVRLLVAWAVLVGGVLASYLAAQRMGVDFASLHAMGKAIINRTDVYDPAWKDRAFPTEYGLGVPPGMFYPPATGFALLAFGALPYAPSKLLWIATLVAAVVAGVRTIVKQAFADATPDLWVALSGLVLMTSAMRWGMTPLQGAPLMFGLLCFFVVALLGARYRLATSIAIFAMAFKMTLALPFLGLLALYRRWGALALVGGSWIALNVLGFWLMGPNALTHYRQGMTVVEAIGDINTPNPWLRISIPRLDWKYLLYGLVHDIRLAQLGGLLLASLTVAYLAWIAFRAWRANLPLTLNVVTPFLAAVVCLGSLCVYHHQYDISLFLVPTLLALNESTRRALPRAAWLACLPLLGIMLVLPIGKVQNLLQSSFSSSAVGFFNMSFPITVSLSLVGALVALAAATPKVVPAVRRNDAP